MTQSVQIRDEVVSTVANILSVEDTTVLESLVDIVILDACMFTGLDNTDESLSKIKNTLVYMLVERYNTVTNMGLSNASVGGISESYNGDYSQSIKSQLSYFKKLKVVV